MQANQLLKHNIDAFLKRRGESRKDLAQWCRRTESWISKIFASANREIPLKYLDRIADFFGVATYQLFQPGISLQTERRQGHDRRLGGERRMGHQQREMLQIGADLEAIRPRLPSVEMTAGERRIIEQLRQRPELAEGIVALFKQKQQPKKARDARV